MTPIKYRERSTMHPYMGINYVWSFVRAGVKTRGSDQHVRTFLFYNLILFTVQDHNGSYNPQRRYVYRVKTDVTFIYANLFFFIMNLHVCVYGNKTIIFEILLHK